MGEETQAVLAADWAQRVSVDQRHERNGAQARPKSVIDDKPFNCPGLGALGPELAILFGEFPKHARPFGIFCHSSFELALPPDLGCGSKCSGMARSTVKSGLARMALAADLFSDIECIGRINPGLRA